MLDIKRIRETPDQVRAALARRNIDTAAIDQILAADQERRALIGNADDLKQQRNAASKEIGNAKRQGQDTTAIQASMRDIGDQITAIDQRLAQIELALQDHMLAIPNTPCPTIPDGKDAADNREVRKHGTPPAFNFEPLDHIALADKLRLLDLPRGTKITGTGFPILTGRGAKLQRALIQYMLDTHTTKHGYTELLPPYVVNTDTMRGTGQLPKMAEDMYHCEVDDLWLIPTAEVPVTNYYRDEIIDAPLPIYLTAYTPCFRREAGSAGKDTRGILRVHQFDKVELVKFVEPETSYDELEKLLKNAETILQNLGLHYRILELCAGDISFSAAKCYDIELWAPGQQAWLEVSSCSNFEDFQARRANIRYRGPDGKPRLIHTLNGSGVALPRLIIAILEQYQQADGTVMIPEVIRPYMGGLDRIEP